MSREKGGQGKRGFLFGAESISLFLVEYLMLFRYTPVVRFFGTTMTIVIVCPRTLWGKINHVNSDPMETTMKIQYFQTLITR